MLMGTDKAKHGNNLTSRIQDDLISKICMKFLIGCGAIFSKENSKGGMLGNEVGFERCILFCTAFI